MLPAQVVLAMLFCFASGAREPAESGTESKRQAVEMSGSQSGAEGTDGEGDAVCVQELLAIEAQRPDASIENLVTAHINKKAAKEIPAVGNPPSLQNQVNEAKLLEWNTVSGRHAARLALSAEARKCEGSILIGSWVADTSALGSRRRKVPNGQMVPSGSFGPRPCKQSFGR